MVGEAGLEPAKAKPADLQSAPFAARDTPPLAVEPHGISGKLQEIRVASGTPAGGCYGDGWLECQPEKTCRRSGYSEELMTGSVGVLIDERKLGAVARVILQN